MFAYGRTIHEHCPRRAHFDAGRFAQQFGDEGHRQGYCLYKLGCKGPATHANCSIQHFGEVPGAWPIGIGHPCVGCTEQELAFQVPIHTTVDIERPTPPDTYPPIHAEHGGVEPGGHRRRRRGRRGGRWARPAWHSQEARTQEARRARRRRSSDG